ncbi:hypothetical protein YERSI8AC_880001 [Enterobacterales bacterium 8AC]|nr:hypothetical protein YERSI8AC_880001 [Enterobacterales bacterium 8AC]
MRIAISYNYLITSHSLLGTMLVHSFGFQDGRKVKHLGTPSLDAAYREMLNNKNVEVGETCKVLYLPTWRHDVTIIDDALNDLNNVVKKIGKVSIDVKLHPFDMGKIETHTLENINILENDVGDMIRFMNLYDCLITDYSSCCFEFYPLKKPIIFYTPDIEEYVSSRGVSIDFSKLIGTNNLTLDAHALEEKIKLIANGERERFIFDFSNYVGDSSDSMERIYVAFS